MQLHDISAYQTSAEHFFERLQAWEVDLVLDVRLHNTNQLAGFTKECDLDYFVREIDHATYVHDPEFSPTADDLSAYLHKTISWQEYAKAYRQDLVKRNAVADFFKKYGSYKSVAIVGTATDKRRSHAEVLVDVLTQALPEFLG
ncbi:DUF488 domain-containing protein [Eggerthellaceae bacterium 3-80]|nr:DUF488 domain-containing protein [bacterium D16-34]